MPASVRGFYIPDSKDQIELVKESTGGVRVWRRYKKQIGYLRSPWMGAPTTASLSYREGEEVVGTFASPSEATNSLIKLDDDANASSLLELAFDLRDALSDLYREFPDCDNNTQGQACSKTRQVLARASAVLSESWALDPDQQSDGSSTPAPVSTEGDD